MERNVWVPRTKSKQRICHAQKKTKLSTFRKNKWILKTFSYLGSLFNANTGAEKDVSNIIKSPWSTWRETTGVMCDRNIPTKLKDKVYKMAIKPKCWAVRKKAERNVHATEMRMLRWARGNARLDHVRSAHIWKRCTHVPDGRIPQREEVELVWTCAKAGWWRHGKCIADDSRWQAKSRQTKFEMAIPGERGYDQKPDDDCHWDDEDRKHPVLCYTL